MTAVDTLTRDWDVEMMDKSSGYIRTAWHNGISGGPQNAYAGRITIKFPELKNPSKMEVKTEAKWLQSVYNSYTGLYNSQWVSGYDSAFQRDVYSMLGGRLGRVVPKD
jgi:hypothetical protein